MPTAQPVERALLVRNAELVEQRRGGARHCRLNQYRDLTQHLGRDVEHRGLAFRIGLGERPRRLAREVAIGFRDNG